MREHHEHVGHLLWELFTRVSALGEARFSKLELSRSALGLLDMITATPGISIAEIARTQPCTQQAISQVAARLEGLGYIERRLVKGRTIGLHPTSAGTRARNAGAATEVAFEKELAATLGTEKYERLRKALLETRPLLARGPGCDETPVPTRRKRARKS